MGVTNGYFGSVPMIQAAGKVPPEQRELAGEAPVHARFTILDSELTSVFKFYYTVLLHCVCLKRLKHTLLLNDPSHHQANKMGGSGCNSL